MARTSWGDVRMAFGASLPARRTRHSSARPHSSAGPQGRRHVEVRKDALGRQRQTVAIARAIYFNARVLIMDESIAALGPQETQQVSGLTLQLTEEGILLISHDIPGVFDLADRVAVIAGRA